MKIPNLLRKYLHILKERPFLVYPFTTAIIFTIGDISCQFVMYKQRCRNSINKSKEKEKFSIDYKRASRQSFFGFVMSPYSVLQNVYIIPYLFPANISYQYIKTLLYLSIIVVPPNQLLYFSYISYFKYNLIDWEFIKTRIIKSYGWGFIFWQPFVYVNYTIVPPLYRILFNNLVNCFWQIYMSFLSFELEKNEVNKNDKKLI
jgi:hypothetical protein